jgi:ABC-type molybdate transport system substrate-binding protein
MAGNQFMVMDELLSAFREACPGVDKVYFETLPPGLELKQILAGGAMFGDRILDVTPDVYASVNLKAMRLLEGRGLIQSDDYFLYLHNRLSLMVGEKNPLRIASVMDLGGEQVRISQPSPDFEDIANHIIEMYRDVGGADLVHRIMEVKRAEGTTIFTVVHHRETPLRLVKGTVDVGPVWSTEITHAQREGLPVDAVELGPEVDQRNKINYYICRLRNSPHREAAEKFLHFIASPRGQGIYKKHGFVPHFPVG